MDLCTDFGTSTSWDMPSTWVSPAASREIAPQESQKAFRRLSRWIAGAEVSNTSNSPAVSALPGEVITEEVLANQEQRRVLVSIFGRFAAEGQISRASSTAAGSLIEALPRNTPLPLVSPDGDGGIQMAWAGPGEARTIALLADNVLWIVIHAGTPNAEYLPEVQFAGFVPEQLLQVIAP